MNVKRTLKSWALKQARFDAKFEAKMKGLDELHGQQLKELRRLRTLVGRLGTED